MKRKLLSVVILVGLVLGSLFGCGRDSTDASTTDRPATADTVADPTEEDSATAGMQEVTMPVVPDEPQELAPDLIDYDPDREIYFTCHDQAYTLFYADSTTPVFSFNIYSLKPLDLDTLEIDLPIETEYFVLSKEVGTDGQHLPETPSLGIDQRNRTTYPYYVYLCQTDMDSRVLRQLYLQYQMFNSVDTESPEQVQAALDAQNAYYDYLYQYYDEFAAIPQEELPVFYCYAVTAVFGRDGLTMEEIMQMPSETFTEFDITISGETYHETVGEGGVSFVPYFEPTGTEIYGNERTYYYDITSAFSSSDGWKPYGGGLFNEWIHHFTCPEDMVLTGIRLVDENQEFVNLYLEVNNVEVEWDGTGVIYLYEGDQVSLEADISDPRSDSLDYVSYIWATLELETAQGKFYELAQIYTGVGGRPLNIYELYFTVFEGLNTSAFWREYYYPVYYPQIYAGS